MSEPERNTTPNTSRGAPSAGILRIVLLYACFAGLWILLSDKAMPWLFSDPAQIVLASTLKGWLFVAVTSLLLYGLMRRLPAQDAPAKLSAEATQLRSYVLPLIVLVTTVVGLTLTGIANTFSQDKEKEVARLQAIADLKTRQIVDWLKERQGDAEFVQSSRFIADNWRRWSEIDDHASRAQLLSRVEKLRQIYGYSAILLMDDQEERIWGSDRAPHDIAPALRNAARQAAADHQVHRIGPYIDMAGSPRLDFIAPINAAGTHPPVIVLHTDPNDWLYRTLQSWPVPSYSAETLLFRRDGEQVLFLNELRHRTDSALKLRLPLATGKLLAAQALRGEVRQGYLVEGVDYRGVPAMGVVRAIPGTDWFLIAKLDRAELYGEALRNSIWIGLTGLLALFITLTGLYLLRQRQQLALALDAQQAQLERLRALGLLVAIADSSDDAIFAKDLEGRFILFNRAASHFSGKPAEEVLGRDERALFPAAQAEAQIAGSRRAITENRAITQEEVLSMPAGERTLLTTKGPLRDGDGKVIGSFGISRDITERKLAEAALRESEATYRSLFENMMNGYAYCRMLYEDGQPHDFIYLDVNQAFGAQTGLRDVVGRKVSEIIPGIREADPGLFEIYGRVALSGQPERVETYVEALRMWFSIAVYSPEREYFVAVFDVITERKQAEQALRESEGRFRALVEQSLAGIYIIQDGRFPYVNPGFAALFGYDSPEALIDRIPVADLVSPQDRERVADSVRRRLDGEAADLNYVFTGLRRDGSHIVVEVHGRAFGYQGRPAVIGLVLDITARKAAEEALARQAGEVRSRNEELERFNRATVGRELDMIALKQRINALAKQLGQEPPYPLAFLDTPERPAGGTAP